MTRVAVFIDYSNVYYTARDVFGVPPGDAGLFGQILPGRLGQFLTTSMLDKDPDRDLVGVAVFLGQPGFKSGRRRQSAADRQIATWRITPLVTVHARPLRYLATAWQDGRETDWNAEEKGIDVLMALAIALGARDNLYDVGVVVSADSDLAPAIDVALAAGKSIETAMWWSSQHPNRKLRTSGTPFPHHRLDDEVFNWVADPIDYAALR